MKYVIVYSVVVCFLCAGFPVSLRAQEAEDAQVNPIQQLLSGTGKIIPDVETNSIMVVDHPFNIEMIKEYLAMTDVPTPQVVIEAKVVEVKLEGEHTLGVNWKILDGIGIGENKIRSDGSSDIEQSIPTRSIKWEPLDGDAQNPFSIGIFSDDMEVVLKALTTALDTEILSAPKITTTNNRRAKIDVLKTIPYLQNVEKEVQDTSAGQQETITFEYSYADEGVSLEVTPLINPDGSISMTLVPQVKEIVQFTALPGPEGLTREPELPETDVRMTHTKVTVQEGQTLVLGGLIREKKTKGQTKVPLLGDIPYLGAMFRTETSTKDKTELLIFVTPKIITPSVIAGMMHKQHMNIGHIQRLEAEEKIYAPLIAKMGTLTGQVQDLIAKRQELAGELYKEKAVNLP